MIANCVELVDAVELVSFDIFDTLLLRPFVKPSDVWREVQVKLLAPGYAVCRKMANRLSYEANSSYDPTLDDAYRYIPFYKFCKKTELQVEMDCLSVNPDMLKIWNYAGKQNKIRVISSDMYLPVKFIEKVLRKNGISGWDKLYVSSELQKTKRSGTLFKQLISDFNAVPLNKMLHIGDNEQSDVKMPSEIGMASFYYEPPMKRFLRSNPFVRRFLKYDTSLSASRIVASLSRINNGIQTANERSYWIKIGAVLGSVLAATYVRFIAEQVKSHKIQRVVFIARDGYSLMPIYDLLNTGVPASYVYAPRLVLKSKDSIDLDEYVGYVKSLGITEDRVAVVDTCTRSFSGQKLVEKALGRKVLGIFLVSFMPPKNGVTLYYDPGLRFRWYNFAEFIFSAPNPPIARIRNLQPVFIDNIPECEKYRIENYPILSRAMIESTATLFNDNVIIKPKQWISWINSFIDCMTEFDNNMFAKVSHCSDAAHKSIFPVFIPPMKKGVRYYIAPLAKRLSYFLGIGVH